MYKIFIWMKSFQLSASPCRLYYSRLDIQGCLYIQDLLDGCKVGTQILNAKNSDLINTEKHTLWTIYTTVFSLHSQCMKWSLISWRWCAAMSTTSPSVCLWWGREWSRHSKVKHNALLRFSTKFPTQDCIKINLICCWCLD